MCSQNKEINNGVRVPLTERGNVKGQKPNTPNPFIKVTDQGGSTCGNTLVELTIALKDDRKRADKAEALARELAEVLLLYEKWEADLLMDHSLWQSPSGLPFITQEVWDDLVAVQTERNKVLHKAKEVLGDEIK